MYKFKILKDNFSVSVYKDGYIVAIIDDAFANKSGYKKAIDYCKSVFN